MLERCRRALVGGLSVMLFPQGTRSSGAGPLPFKDGAFELAIGCQVPVIPVAIAGTDRCMRKGSPRIRRARGVAMVLDPIQTTGLTAGDVPTLRDQVRDRIAAASADLEQRLARGEAE
jgi:1-acyl-sn-glycerol-3-phosphate acyltransferase